MDLFKTRPNAKRKTLACKRQTEHSNLYKYRRIEQIKNYLR